MHALIAMSAAMVGLTFYVAGARSSPKHPMHGLAASPPGVVARTEPTGIRLAELCNANTVPGADEIPRVIVREYLQTLRAELTKAGVALPPDFDVAVENAIGAKNSTEIIAGAGPKAVESGRELARRSAARLSMFRGFLCTMLTQEKNDSVDATALSLQEARVLMEATMAAAGEDAARILRALALSRTPPPRAGK